MNARVVVTSLLCSLGSLAVFAQDVPKLPPRPAAYTPASVQAPADPGCEGIIHGGVA